MGYETRWIPTGGGETGCWLLALGCWPADRHAPENDVWSPSYRWRMMGLLADKESPAMSRTVSAARPFLMVRSLAGVASRRGLARVAGGFAVAAPLGALFDGANLEAKKKRKNNKRRRGSCTDGKRNGKESDVDCGGKCPACAIGQRCKSRHDCATALCANNRCQPCSTRLRQCGEDAIGTCFCETEVGGDVAIFAGVCNSPVESVAAATCDDCPAGMNCLPTPGTEVACLPRCGAS
jgi:hypothetical protein